MWGVCCCLNVSSIIINRLSIDNFVLVCISNDCRLIFAILTARKWQPTNVLTFITKCCILQPATFAKSQHTRLSCTGHRFTQNSIKSAQINQKLRRKPIKMQRFHLNFERFCLISIYPDLIEALNYIEILMRFFFVQVHTNAIKLGFYTEFIRNHLTVYSTLSSFNFHSLLIT